MSNNTFAEEGWSTVKEAERETENQFYVFTNIHKNSVKKRNEKFSLYISRDHVDETGETRCRRGSTTRGTARTRGEHSFTLPFIKI